MFNLRHGLMDSGSPVARNREAGYTAPPQEISHRQAKSQFSQSAGAPSRRACRRFRLNLDVSVTTSSNASQHKAETIELHAEIERLRQSEKRLKSRLRERNEALKDIKTELLEFQEMLANTEQDLHEKVESLDASRLEVDRYRGWWLNEYHFIRILLDIIPNPQHVSLIADSSHARYTMYRATNP